MQNKKKQRGMFGAYYIAIKADPSVPMRSQRVVMCFIRIQIKIGSVVEAPNQSADNNNDSDDRTCLFSRTSARSSQAIVVALGDRAFI